MSIAQVDNSNSRNLRKNVPTKPYVRISGRDPLGAHLEVSGFLMDAKNVGMKTIYTLRDKDGKTVKVTS